MPEPDTPSRAERAGGVAFVAITIFGAFALLILAVVALPLVVVAFPLTITFVTISLSVAFIVHRLRRSKR